MKTSAARLETNRRWRMRNRDHLREYHRRWRDAHRDRFRAHHAVHRALKSGKLTRPDACEGCGNPPAPNATLQGHHHNGYEARLDVKWLCPACHAEAHPDRH